MLTESIYVEIVLICIMDRKPLLSQKYHFKTLTNERTICRIGDETFEKIDAFSKIISIFEFFKQEKQSEPCKIYFRNF